MGAVGTGVCLSRMCSRFSVIICRGVVLMAGPPTSSPNPGRVTVPTPCPPWICITCCRSPPVCSFFSEISMDTVATMGSPFVTSGSSPPSLITVQETSMRRSVNEPVTEWTGTAIFSPLGSKTETSFILFPGMGDRSLRRAALAAAVAHVPVVSPLRRGRKSGRKCSMARRIPFTPFTVWSYGGREGRRRI